MRIRNLKTTLQRTVLIYNIFKLKKRMTYFFSTNIIWSKQQYISNPATFFSQFIQERKVLANYHAVDIRKTIEESFFREFWNYIRHLPMWFE